MKLAHPVRPWKLSPGNLRLRNGIKISQPFAASLSFHIVSRRLFFCSLKGMAANSSQRIGYPKLPWTKSAPIADITGNTHWLEVMGIEPYKNIDLNHNRLNNYKQLTYIINTYDTVIKQPLYTHTHIYIILYIVLNTNKQKQTNENTILKDKNQIKPRSWRNRETSSPGAVALPWWVQPLSLPATPWCPQKQGPQKVIAAWLDLGGTFHIFSYSNWWH